MISFRFFTEKLKKDSVSNAGWIGYGLTNHGYVRTADGQQTKLEKIHLLKRELKEVRSLGVLRLHRLASNV